MGNAIARDRELVARLPHGEKVAWGVAAVAALFGLVRFGIDAVYTESLVFLLLAMIAGFAAPTLGVLFIAAYAIGAIPYSLSEPLLVVVARLITYWLLWLLVVEIPLQYRAIARATERSIGRGALGTVVGIGAGALMAGAFVFVWTHAGPILVRPVFTWKGASPSVEAIVVMQRKWGLLVAAAVFLAAAATALRRYWKVEIDAARAAAARPLWRAVFMQVAVAALLTLALSGMVTKKIDVVILFAAFLGARPLARLVLRDPRVDGFLGAIPLAVRFLLGFALTYVVSFPIVKIAFGRWASEFFPLVLSTAFGILIFAILLGARRRRNPAPPAVARQRHALGGAALGFGLWFVLGMASPAGADNCSGWGDCYGSAAAAAAAAGGAAAAGAGGGWPFGGGDGDEGEGDEEPDETAGGDDDDTTPPPPENEDSPEDDSDC